MQIEAATEPFVGAGSRPRMHELTAPLALPPPGEALARAAAAREPGLPAELLASLGWSIAESLGLPEDRRWEVAMAAALHDVGKLCVPDDVLRHPHTPTPESWELLHGHPGHGATLLRAIPGLTSVGDLVQDHHERLDGSGYPAGLRAGQIPLAVRIVSVLDVLDGLTSRRPYRTRTHSFAEALDVLRREAGEGYWDPVVVQALSRCLDEGELEDPQAAPEEVEARELRQGRLADIGRITGGVAHQISNASSALHSNLTLIAGHASVLGRFLAGLDEGKDAATLRAELELDLAVEDIAEASTESLDAVDDIITLVKDLRGYTADGTAGLDAETPIDEAVSSALLLASSELKYRAAVSVELSGLPRVRLAKAQAVQLLLNLLTNAAQAVGREQAAGRQVRGHVRVVGRVRGDEVVLEIHDDGPGVPVELTERIFSPYFTTRADEGARGLGLFLCRRIAQAVGGDVECESQPGSGAVFAVRLPVAKEPPTESG